MGRPPPPRLPIVVVRWFDASFQAGSLTLADLETRCEMVTAGHLVREDGESISIALDHCPQHGDWRDVTHIPKVNVLNIRRLKG